jgi:hypothetical protein
VLEAGAAVDVAAEGTRALREGGSELAEDVEAIPGTAKGGGAGAAVMGLPKPGKPVVGTAAGWLAALEAAGAGLARPSKVANADAALALELVSFPPSGEALMAGAILWELETRDCTRSIYLRNIGDQSVAGDASRSEAILVAKAAFRPASSAAPSIKEEVVCDVPLDNCNPTSSMEVVWRLNAAGVGSSGAFLTGCDAGAGARAPIDGSLGLPGAGAGALKGATADDAGSKVGKEAFAVLASDGR